jgi:pyruvate formate lyase activating enzyme
MIVFTYTEPTIHPEYVEEVGRLIRERSLPIKLLVKTNGYSSEEYIKKLCLAVDAWNVDIKGDDFHYRQIGADSVHPVTESICSILESDKHLEISYLVLPDNSGSEFVHREVARWILSMEREFNKYIPVHLLCYYPCGTSNQVCDTESMLRIRGIFLDDLDYVYVSNSYDSSLIWTRNSHCPSCGVLMVRREEGVEIVKQECCNQKVYNVVV